MPRADAAHPSAVSLLGGEYRRDKVRRFSIPESLIEKATWPTGQTLDLIAEAVEAGRVKLYLADRIKAALDARRNGLEQSAAEDRANVLAAFAQKYQRAAYALNGQVALPTTAAFNLGIQKDVSEDVLLEVIGETIEILSLRFVAERSERYGDQIAV